MSRVLASIVAICLAGCSLAVTKPAPAYRTGVLPDCSDSYVPPGLDFTVGAASLGTMALDDDFFCVLCPLPWVAAALFFTTGVIGARRASKCGDQIDQHEQFLSLPQEEQRKRIEERRAAED